MYGTLYVVENEKTNGSGTLCPSHYQEEITMFDNLTIAEIATDSSGPFKRFYCRLSEPVNPNDLDDGQWDDLIDLVCDRLGLIIKPRSGAGSYFANVTVWARNQRMIVTQFSGLDV